MSYDPSLPTARDRMRFTLGDTVQPELKSDVEYDALLALHSEPEATAKMAEALASQFAQDPSSINIGGISVSYSTLVSNWQKIAETIRESLATMPATPSFTSGRLRRYDEEDASSEYRRPLDWDPSGYIGDAW